MMVDGSQRAKACFAHHQRYHSYLQGVTTSLSVVAALITAAILSVILNPPEVIYNASKWKETQPACNSLASCARWRDIYSVAGPVALLLELTTLLVAVAVTMGTDWLEGALAFFAVSLWPLLLMIAAALWLSCTTAVAGAGSTLICLFFITSWLPLLPAFAAMFARYSVVPVQCKVAFQTGSKSVAYDRGMPVLHWAAAGSNWRFVRFWKIITLHVFLSSHDPDREGTWLIPYTPLGCAAAMGFLEAVQILLAAGADPNHQTISSAINDKDFTALHVAAMRGDIHMMEALLNAGADPNVVGPDGSSALDGCEDKEVVALLLSRGAKAAMAPAAIAALLLYSSMQYDADISSSSLGLRDLLVQKCVIGVEPEVVRVLLAKLSSEESWLNEAVLVTGGAPAKSMTAAAATDCAIGVLRVLREDGRIRPDAPDGNGDLPLLLACLNWSPMAAAEIADWLLGGRPDQQLRLLHMFSARDTEECLAMAAPGGMSHERRIYLTRLMNGCLWDWSAAVQVMLAKVGDPNVLLRKPSGVWEPALLAAARAADTNIVLAFKKDGRANPLLCSSDGVSPLDAMRMHLSCKAARVSQGWSNAAACLLSDFKLVGELEAWVGGATPLWEPHLPGAPSRDKLLHLICLTRSVGTGDGLSEPAVCIKVTQFLGWHRDLDPSDVVETAVPPFAAAGTTPLLVAVQAAKLGVVRVYIRSRRADPTRACAGITPLIAAQQVGDPALVQEISDWVDHFVVSSVVAAAVANVVTGSVQ